MRQATHLTQGKPDLLDRLVVPVLGEGTDIQRHEVDVRPEHRGQLTHVVRLDDEEAGATAGEVVPPANELRRVRSPLVLMEDAFPHFLWPGVGEPSVAAVEEHGQSPCMKRWSRTFFTIPGRRAGSLDQRLAARGILLELCNVLAIGALPVCRHWRTAIKGQGAAVATWSTP